MENFFVLVASISVVILLIIQAAVFIGFFLLAKRIVVVIERASQLQTRAEFLLNNTEPVLKMATGMMSELKQATGYLTQGIQHITAITEMAKDEAAEVRGLLGDSTALAKREVERAKSQVDKVQSTITTATDQFERTTLMVQNSVLEPAREFSYVMAGVRRALEVMLAGRRLPVDRAYQDEEMFI